MRSFSNKGPIGYESYPPWELHPHKFIFTRHNVVAYITLKAVTLKFSFQRICSIYSSVSPAMVDSEIIMDNKDFSESLIFF